MTNFRKPRTEQADPYAVSQEQYPVANKVETPVQQMQQSVGPSDILQALNNGQLTPEAVQMIKSIVSQEIQKDSPAEKIKDSKRKYGFEMDGVTIRKSEPRKYKFRILMDNLVEKAVIQCDTVGRPVSDRNFNTGKWIHEHSVKIKFYDGTEKVMDLIEYLQRSYYCGDDRDGEYVQYDDIHVRPDGTRDYTFRTSKFGTLTINQLYIG